MRQRDRSEIVTLPVRLTPRLWTKTNFILASMLVADIMTGMFMLWYTPFLVVAYVFNNPCRYNISIALLTALLKAPGAVSIYHLILISVERYIAIVHPLHYETKFTDRTLKWALSAGWAAGILLMASYALWLINTDLRKCDLIPAQYYLIELLFAYLPVCICLFTCYGKILTISWRQRKRVKPEPANVSPAAEASRQTAASTGLAATESNKPTGSDRAVDPKEKPLAGAGPPAKTSGRAAASAELTQQQREKIKCRRREFKAVYLTAAIVGTFVILWFPYMVGHILAAVDHDPLVVNSLSLAAGAIGSSNYAFTWAIYAAVSKRYRRAYRQMLIRIGCCCCKNVTLPADDSLVV